MFPESVPSMETGLFVVHAALTWFLTGLIWVVQLVHYPLFSHVPPAAFPAFARRHARRIAPIVAPTMAGEALTGAWLLLEPPPGAPRWAWAAGAVLIVVVWASTACLQVPCHARLAEGFDASTHARLVRSNWLRTIAWSLRAALLAVLLPVVLAG